MTIAIDITNSIVTHDPLCQIHRTLPCLETSFIEVRLKITMLKPGDQLLIILFAVFCHELGTDVKDFTTGNGQIILLIVSFGYTELKLVV